MTLYEFDIDGETLFGKGLATNSKGELVLEVKGSNKVIVIDKEKARAVLPYTIAIKFLCEPAKKYHYIYEGKQPLKVGDLIFIKNSSTMTYGLATVTQVDTKCKHAKPTLNGWFISDINL